MLSQYVTIRYQLAFSLFTASVFLSLPAEATHYKPTIFSLKQGDPWVQECLQNNPELLLFFNQTPLQQPPLPSFLPRYSQKFLNQNSRDFNEILYKFHTLKLILNGEKKTFLEFTQGSSLSKHSFTQLHELACSIIHSCVRDLSPQELYRCLQKALIAQNLPTPDKTHSLFLKNKSSLSYPWPQSSHFFNELSPNALLFLEELQTTQRYQHLFFLESSTSELKNTIQVLSRYNQTVSQTNLLLFFLYLISQEGTSAYTNFQHQQFAYMLNLLTQSSDEFSYEKMLAHKLNLLGISHPSRQEQTLMRLATLMNQLTPDHYKKIEIAFFSLSKKSQDSLIRKLDPQNSPLTILGTKELFNTLSGIHNFEKNKEEPEPPIVITLLCLAKSVQQFESNPQNQHTTINLFPLVPIAQADPSLLFNPFYIESHGNIHVDLD